MRVINDKQEILGVMTTAEALAMAREQGLDLVEVSPTERPPVCRIMDYGKHLYEKKKRQKIAGHGHTITLKEIRLRPKTDPHDRQIKIRRAQGFLADGHKVQFTMLFKGRERFNREFAHEVFNTIIADLGETAKIERAPFMDGRKMTMLVTPGKPAGKSGGGGSAAAGGDKTAGGSNNRAGGPTRGGLTPPGGTGAAGTTPAVAPSAAVSSAAGAPPRMEPSAGSG